MEKMSMLVSRVDGAMVKVYAESGALCWAVRNRGPKNDAPDFLTLRHPDPPSMPTPEELAEMDDLKEDGWNVTRVPFEDVRSVHILRTPLRTCITLLWGEDEETVWHMNEPLPDEAIAGIFGPLSPFIQDEAEALESEEDEELPDDEPMFVQARSLGEDSILTAAAVILFVLALLNPGKGWMVALPAFEVCAGVRLAQRVRGGQAAFRWMRLAWMLPGAALWREVRGMNLIQPVMLILPAMLFALLLTVVYMLLCGENRTARRTAMVLAGCLILCFPVAGRINGLGGEVAETQVVAPSLVREHRIEAWLDGQNRTLYLDGEGPSARGSCEVQRVHGLLGADYYRVNPIPR